MRVWHVTVRELGASAIADRRFIHRTAEDAEAARDRAQKAGFVARVDVVERHRETVGAR